MADITADAILLRAQESSSSADAEISPNTRDSYRTMVLADGATGYWKLDEPDEASNADCVVHSEIGPEATFWPPYGFAYLPGGDYRLGVRGVAMVPNSRTGWRFGAEPYPIRLDGYVQTEGSKCSVEVWCDTVLTGVGKLWSAGDGMRLFMENGFWTLRFDRGFVYVTTVEQFNDGELHHVVGVWDGEDGVQMLSSQLHVYVDGAEVETVGYETPWWASAWSAPFTGSSGIAHVNDENYYGSWPPARWIGGQWVPAGGGQYWPTQPWVGFVDEVAHYNGVALSPAQVLRHYQTGMAEPFNIDAEVKTILLRPEWSPHAERTASADAMVVNPFRTQHDRGDGPSSRFPHYDADLDSVITLAKSIGAYSEGMDLHSALSSIVGRVTSLESSG